MQKIQIQINLRPRVWCLLHRISQNSKPLNTFLWRAPLQNVTQMGQKCWQHGQNFTGVMKQNYGFNCINFYRTHNYSAAMWIFPTSNFAQMRHEICKVRVLTPSSKVWMSDSLWNCVCLITFCGGGWGLLHQITWSPRTIFLFCTS
jgi:hypothetical protein